MVTVRIVSGCYGARVDGKHKVITKGQTVAVHEDEAAYLCSLGVAVIEKEPVLSSDSHDTGGTGKDEGDTSNRDENAATDGLIEGRLSEDELREMSYEQLKKMAIDCGLQPGKLKSKENIIKALAEQICYVSPEEDVEDEEEPPSPEVEAPVV
ncbi:MAG: hypothetical protein IJ657_00285 [Acidaminococcaceae bacterium]|nr:hypothetical protein [Acidaminococcaceae bacterium]